MATNNEKIKRRAGRPDPLHRLSRLPGGLQVMERTEDREDGPGWQLHEPQAAQLGHLYPHRVRRTGQRTPSRSGHSSRTSACTARTRPACPPVPSGRSARPSRGRWSTTSSAASAAGTAWWPAPSTSRSTSGSQHHPGSGSAPSARTASPTARYRPASSSARRKSCTSVRYDEV